MMEAILNRNRSRIMLSNTTSLRYNYVVEEDIMMFDFIKKKGLTRTYDFLRYPTFKFLSLKP